MNFYQKGRYQEALHEFQKALLVDPNYPPALKYIQMVQQTQGLVSAKAAVIRAPVTSAIVPADFKSRSATAEGTVQELMDLVEIQRDMMKDQSVVIPSESLETVAFIQPPKPRIASTGRGPKKKEAEPKLLLLDDRFNALPQPFEIAQESSVIIVGRNISRFLSTTPEALYIERKSNDELIITGKNIGYTVLHVWDENGRWTSEWITTFPHTEADSYAELMLKEEERARTFKLRYSLDWVSFETGRKVRSWRRNYYSWAHGLQLLGQTPYGDVDSNFNVRSIATTTDLTSASVGLTNGQLGTLKGFSLRGLDVSPNFGNLAFPGATIRGGLFSSPAFNNKLDYTLFWGREGGGRYGNLSPSIEKGKNTYLDGAHVSFSPLQSHNYQLSAVEGWGRDRESYLHRYGYDFTSNWYFRNLNMMYDVAYDTEKYAHRARADFRLPRFGLGLEFRDVNKAYNSITGAGWAQGNLGGTLNLDFQPTEKLSLSNTIDVYQDRLYPAEEKHSRLNEDGSWNANYQIDPKTSVSLNYYLQNELGKMSQSRYQSGGWGIAKKFDVLKGMYTHFNYYHQEQKNYSSPSSDYINDKIYTGARLNFIGQFYYFINREFYWTTQRATGIFSSPTATETGIDWSDTFGNLPLSGNFRLTYRDEEDAETDMSFLSGQDYLEGYAELSYHPAPNSEFYGSARVRNIWADSERATKNMEAGFNAGMRYLWDTGVRWETMTDIEGYVFKDYNSDGLRQRDEPPIEGAKIWLGKDRFEVTNVFGYYKFRKVRARKAFVSFDLNSLPSGYVLTVPVTQEVALSNIGTLKINFGMAAHSEIRGYVFEDVNHDGQFDAQDKGIGRAVVLLENGKKVATSADGRFSFANVNPGTHKIKLELNSLPIYYLPKTAITREITLSEGEEYVYNIPLRRVQE